MVARGYDALFKPKTRGGHGQDSGAGAGGGAANNSSSANSNGGTGGGASGGAFGKVDGCASFFKRSKFTLIEHHAVNFNDLARQFVMGGGAGGGGRDEVGKQVHKLTKDNVALALILECSPSPSAGASAEDGLVTSSLPGGVTYVTLGPPPYPPAYMSAPAAPLVLVANTHLYSNVSRPD
eukprot:gene21441-26271_t